MNTSIHLPNSRFGNPTCERAGRSGKNMPANSARAFVQVCAAFMLGAAPLSASTWVGGEAGKWGDAVKWSGGVPGGNSDVLIQGLANVVVGEATSDDMLTIQKLDLVPDGGVSPRLRISGLGNRPFLASDTFTMDGNAVLEVDGSTLRIDGLMGGHLNFLAGEMLLRVGRIQTTRGATFRVGRTGNGHLSMLSGELVAEGDLIVGGLGGSSGLLELHSGVVAVTGLLQVADDIGSEGLVRIHGGEIVATNITVRIGDDGRGSLEMRGGSARFGDVSVGRDLTGEGQLSVVGGRLEAGDISLGRLSGSRGIATFAGGEVLLPPWIISTSGGKAMVCFAWRAARCMPRTWSSRRDKARAGCWRCIQASCEPVTSTWPPRMPRSVGKGDESRPRPRQRMVVRWLWGMDDPLLCSCWWAGSMSSRGGW
jgi:hypothetical protein